MKTISAEDNSDLMRYSKNTAMAILVIAVIIMLLSSFFITSTTISDADPSTYVIVPILMLPLFLLFVLKRTPEPEIGKKDVATGISIFALFLILTLAFRSYFSLFFVSFRIDMFLFPLAVTSLVLLLFGARNIGRFRGPILYPLLASPAILTPILNISNAFVQFNTLAVYGFIKLFINGAQYAAPITISANGYSIGIGQACVSLGIFIALTLFLIPIAYFYEGKGKNKITWVVKGVVLLLILNVLRMLGVSYVWLAYGPNVTASVVHTFIGSVLFYFVIVFMILTARFHGLEAWKAKKSRGAGAGIKKINSGIVFVALLLAALYLYLTLNYSSALVISPLALENRIGFNFNNTQIARPVISLVDRANFTNFFIEGNNASYVLFSLSNKTINSTNPLVLVVAGQNYERTQLLELNNTFLGEMDFFSNKGTIDRGIDVISNGTEFIVYNTELPLVFSNQSSADIGMYLIFKRGQLPLVSGCSGYDPVYSGILNIVNPVNYNQTMREKLVSVECTGNRIIWHESS